MTRFIGDTQPARAIKSGRAKARRLFLFMFLVIGMGGSLAFGFALGIGAGALAPARAVVLTSIASLSTTINVQLASQPTVVDSQGGGGG